MKHLKAKVISQRKIHADCFRMSLRAPSVAKGALPGQFVHIRCGSSTQPFLRRPVSIHRIRKDGIDLLYNVVGEGTRWLSGRSVGEEIDMIGPLGNGFEVSSKDSGIKLFVAGGMGVAPLVALAERLFPKKASGGKFTVILGARTKGHIFCEREFRLRGARVLVSTEDGSKGRRGLATDAAEDFFKPLRGKLNEVSVYAAGPLAMIRTLCVMARGCGEGSQVSLEERMACGVGACLGCAIDTRSGYKRVCKDGPVFRLCEVLTDQEEDGLR